MVLQFLLLRVNCYLKWIFILFMFLSKIRLFVYVSFTCSQMVLFVVSKWV